jgi:hypothetical protein
MIACALAVVGAIPRTQVRAKIDEILARPEFAKSTGPSALEQFIDRLLHALGELFGVEVGAARLMLWVVVALIVCAIAVVTWRTVRTSRAQARVRTARGVEITAADQRHERVADLRARAGAARAAGQHLLALRLYFTALVVGLGEAGDLEYRDAWTNRELFERGRPKPAVASALAPLLADLDHKSFGGAAATERDVDAMAQLVEKLLRAPVKR